MTDRHEVVALGAGLTGLSFGYHYDPALPIYEREASPGGLIRTLAVDDYRFDLAPHLLHFRSDRIRSLVLEELGLETEQHTRQARIYFGDRIMSYPFELNLFSTPNNVRDDCLAGLDQVMPDLRAQEEQLRSGSFADYSQQAFGPGISEHYLLPYNRKIWDTDPADMTCEWMRFLPTADLDKIREGAFEANTDRFGYNTQFHYPCVGGIQDLAEAFARKLSGVRYGRTATAIDVSERTVRFDDGECVGYERLVSSLPLKQLVRMTGLAALQPLADKLVNTTVYIVNVVIKGQVPEGVHWIYFPDPEVEFYRVSLPKNYFRGAAPDGEHIIAAEIGSRNASHDVEGFTQAVVDRVRQVSCFEVEEVVRTHTAVIPHAYCIYDRDRTATVDSLRASLAGHGIVSSGRYGRWEYSAMEDAIQYGIDLAEQMRGASV